MRLQLELAALLGAGVILWRLANPPPPPPAPPLVPPGTTLAMPKSSGRPKAPAAESAMNVIPEDTRHRELPLGNQPILSRAAAEAAHVDYQPVPAPEPKWWERYLDPESGPWAAGAVAVIFIALWGIIGRAIGRGPGSGTYTHD